jgi:hypothetical protein
VGLLPVRCPGVLDARGVDLRRGRARAAGQGRGRQGRP